MKYSHLFLKNPVGTKNYVNTNRYVPQEEDSEDDDEYIRDHSFQKNILRDNLSAFRSSRAYRREHRTLEIPHHLEYIEIRFLTHFNNAANYYNRTFGLDPINYSDFNKTVLFYIENQVLFQNFIRLIEQFYNSPSDENPDNQEYHVVTLIYSFEFLSSNKIKKLPVGRVIISLTNIKNGARARDWEDIERRLLEYILEKGGVIAWVSDGILELSKLNNFIDEIVDNFDIIQKVQSMPSVHVRPSSFGTLRYDWGFRTLHSDELPIVGVIDSGIASIPPLKDLIKGETTILDRVMGIGSEHGTNVASIIAFGGDLKLETTEKDSAAYLYSIQVLYNNNDGSFSYNKLREEIITAHRSLGVRIFNLSICGISNEYNSEFSPYAMMLDELAYNFDLLIFIACGNYELNCSKIIRELEGAHTDLVSYPNHYYNSISPDYSQPSNMGSPAESMNNITVGAIASNLRCNTVDLTTAHYLPAYYSRKYYVDYSQTINGTGFTNNQKNKNIFKPDILMPGGDWSNDNSGIVVLGRGVSFHDYHKLTAGTSIATPLAANLAAKILLKYPLLNMQSVKALLINSSNKTNIQVLIDSIILQCKENKAMELHGQSFERLERSEKIAISKIYSAERLANNIEGHGLVDEEECINSTEKRVTFIIEDSIRFRHYQVQHIKIPAYLLQASKNRILKIKATLCFKFAPVKNDQLAYNPIHISFNFINAQINSNESAKVVANEHSVNEPALLKQMLGIHANLDSWSDDFGSLNRKIYSNSQKKSFIITKSELQKTNNEIAIVIRCVGKVLYWDSAIENPYSLAITIEETDGLNLEQHNLYNELSAINNVESVLSVDNAIDINLEN